MWALASPVHRDAILNACDTPELEGIKWIFPAVQGWPLRPGVEPRRERTYNLLWQWQARRHGRSIVRRERIDVIHHASWAGIRAPTFLGGLGPPLIIGPVGGGETSPSGMRDQIGVRGRVLEWIRDLSNRTITYNPVVRPGLRQAVAVFVSTCETERLFAGSMHDKTRVFSQMSLGSLPPARQRKATDDPVAFIYAGRLLYWKGLHIALRAIAQLVESDVSARLTIVGDGVERARLQTLAGELGIADYVQFISRVPQADLFVLYDKHDFMLFPSLHDSGGMAPLEAMARGLPVVCLDLGGPGQLVTEGSGLVIATAGRSTDEVAAVMADTIRQALCPPNQIGTLSAGAIQRAAEFSALKRVPLFYGEVAKLLATSAPH